MLLTLLVAVLAGAPASGWRASADIAGHDATIELRGLTAELAEPLLREALEGMAADRRRLDSAVASVNAIAGAGRHRADPDLVALLGRALEFCRWSEGAHGPLGGAAYALWRDAVPAAEALRGAVDSARCERLAVDDSEATVELAAGSRLDLRGFVHGWLVDRAAARLRDAGVGNGRIRLGGVERGWGAGPADAGWPAALPAVGLTQPLAARRLHDEALARTTREPPMTIGGDLRSPHLDLRRGRPVEGVLAVVAVSELALDAEALARTAFVLGSREGTLRAGALRPRPSLLWLLGGPEGPAVVTSHHWLTPRARE